MSERFTKLFALPENLYRPGAPVMIAAGALQKDSETGRVLGQLKLKNIQDKEIKAVKVHIAPFDTAGKPLGDAVEHQYLDLSAARDTEFGAKSAIKLADANTRSFTVTVAEAVFSDGSIWTGSGEVWEPLAPPAPLEQVLKDGELVKQYQIKYGQDCKYQTKQEKDLWFCACGAVNRDGETTCHRCGKDPSALNRANLDALKQERDQRLAAEAKQAAEAKAAAEIQAKKMKKIAMIAVPILLVVLIAGVFFSDYSKKNEAYNAAAALLEERQFDDAMDAFAELDGFKDSHEQAYQNAAYQKALYLITCAETDNKDGLKVSTRTEPKPKVEDGQNAPAQAGNSAGTSAAAAPDDGERENSAERTTAVKCYRKAAAILEKLGGYQDSAQKLQEVNDAIDAALLEADYQDAIALLEEQEDHPAARDAFEALGDYKDAKTYFEGFRWLRVGMHLQDEPEEGYFIRYDENGEILPDQGEGPTVTVLSADGRTKTVKNSQTGEVVSVTEYDQYGNVTRREEGIYAYTFTYELDGNGRPIQSTETKVSASGGSLFYIANVAYEYNGKGQLTKRTETATYNFDLKENRSPTHVYVFTYTYDDQGNLSSYTQDSTSYRYLYSSTKTTHSVNTFVYDYDWVYAPGLEQ